ncbi:saccharopine dehydrogenase [Diaporthe amygdali]|uniref:saccharopine dehydrogenase n=1 Tax=Phomopsis amygdali TaxID=1214568 RepID=UPI0022FE8199|nr:saccharopine dehydrogenase [Diaporthe amygdali]KAJ0110292.1 saccharopine dehydrogenase [Diaporthe amygdali]
MGFCISSAHIFTDLEYLFISVSLVVKTRSKRKKKSLVVSSVCIIQIRTTSGTEGYDRSMTVTHEFELLTHRKSHREYGLVVLGASGLTGTMVCTHIAAKFPTNPTWAVAGLGRLEKLAAKLRKEYPDRVQPDLKVVAPDDTQSLGEVIGGGAKVCISSVVYAVDGEAIVRACIEQLTDYVDCAEVPTLIRDLVANYHEQAVAKGVAGVVGTDGEDDDPEQVHLFIYQTLLSLYLTPPPLNKHDLPLALELLSKHDCCLPAISIFSLNPDPIPIDRL